MLSLRRKYKHGNTSKALKISSHSLRLERAMALSVTANVMLKWLVRCAAITTSSVTPVP